MDSLPLVSVICLCYNQKKFLADAIRSVQRQSYAHTELIVVDDASTDGSQELLIELNQEIPFQLILNQTNMGNCKSFNLGFTRSKGEWIIDLAGDDILLPQRIEEGVGYSRPEVGVQYSDAFLIDEAGKTTGTFYARNAEGQLLNAKPQGMIYQELITQYFICPTSMMIRRSVLEVLGGYDERLSYEDFDFWMRSSRHWEYQFHRAPLVQKRILKNGLGQQQRHLRNKHASSTYRVCEQIFELNQNPAEDRALIQRCQYEIKHVIKTLNLEWVMPYLQLIRKILKRMKSSAGYRRLSPPSSIDK